MMNAQLYSMGETKNDPPAAAVKSCRLPPSDKGISYA